MQVQGLAGNYQAIIFDMDGLLINSEKLYWEANIQAAAEEGINTPKDSYLKLTGATVAEMNAFYDKYFPSKAALKKFVDRTNELVWQWTDAGKLKLQPGVQRALDCFQDRNLRMAVASSNYQNVVEHAMWATGIRNYFEFYLSYADVQKGKIKPKPAPDIYLAAAKKIGVAKEQILVFEDSATGVAAAKNAGIDVVMVPDLLSPTATDKKNAAMIVKDFNEFLKKI